MSWDDFLNDISVESFEIDSKKNLKNEKNREERLLKDKKKKPRGGYRPVLIAEDQLIQESHALKSKFDIINSKCVLNSDLMTPQDIVSYYIICYLDQRYPNQLFENFSRLTTVKVKSKLLSDLNFQPRNKNTLTRLKKIGAETLFDVVNMLNLHSIPMTARHTLVNWYLEKFDLKLFINQIPSSKEVLRLQAQEKRCVSLIADKIDCLVLDERDPLSFLIHDLVHAYKMFSNEYLKKGQVGFYKALLKLFCNETTKEFLDNFCSNDEVFKEDLDYLISDMNSHPRHLFYYLKAILINGIKRKFMLGKEDFLKNDSLEEFDRIFDSMLSAFNMNGEEKKLSKKLIFEENDSLENLDFSLLDNFFINI